MSMFGHMKRPDGGYKKGAIDVLSKEEIEKLIDEKIEDNIDDTTTTKAVDTVSASINKMLVNKERSKLYSIYHFTTGDITNMVVKHVEVNKSLVKKGEDGRSTTVVDKQLITEVANWYNCSRYSISEENSDNTLFLTAGGTSDYGVSYTRVKNKGYMKDCLLMQDGKNMNTLYGIDYYTKYSFYFSFRAVKPGDEIFYQ